MRDADAYPQDILFGFGIKQVLKVAAFERMRADKDKEFKPAVPVRLWHNPVAVYDPGEMLLTAREEKVIAWETVAQALGVTIPEEYSYNARANAYVCADVVRVCQIDRLRSGVTVA